MEKFLFLITLGGLFLAFGVQAVAGSFETDVLETSQGPLKITFIGHGSLILTFDGKIIHVDPFSKLTDYSALPKADMIILTHEHQDHLDPVALKGVRTEKTTVVLTAACAQSVDGGIVMKNGDVQTIAGLKIEAVPAYNLVHMRSEGVPYHPKGTGNGYVMTFGDKRVYLAGDTENIPEMKDLKNIDCAFLPMNLPYTMTPEMVAAAAKAFKPKILYPYHFGNTDPEELVKLMQDQPEVQVRIRKMQ